MFNVNHVRNESFRSVTDNLRDKNQNYNQKHKIYKRQTKNLPYHDPGKLAIATENANESQKLKSKLQVEYTFSVQKI